MQQHFIITQDLQGQITVIIHMNNDFDLTILQSYLILHIHEFLSFASHEQSAYCLNTTYLDINNTVYFNKHFLLSVPGF